MTAEARLLVLVHGGRAAQGISRALHRLREHDGQHDILPGRPGESFEVAGTAPRDRPAALSGLHRLQGCCLSYMSQMRHLRPLFWGLLKNASLPASKKRMRDALAAGIDAKVLVPLAMLVRVLIRPEGQSIQVGYLVPLGRD